jgi:hypothetical protein
VGAGLFLRTLFALWSVDAGFRTDHLILFSINPPASRYAAGKDVQLHSRLEEDFAAIPGVQAVTTASVAYIGNGIDGYFSPPGRERGSNYAAVGILQCGGEQFLRHHGNTDDCRPSLRSAGYGYLAQSCHHQPEPGAQRFPNVNPVGKQFKTGDDAAGWVRIVGICADARYMNLRDDPPPQFFLLYRQQSDVGGIKSDVVGMNYAVRPDWNRRRWRRRCAR